MRDRTFKHLINHYLDGSITPSQLLRLRNETQANPRRKAEFDTFVRLHWATRLASFDKVRRRAMVNREPAKAYSGVWATLSAGAAAAICIVAVYMWMQADFQQRYAELLEAAEANQETRTFLVSAPPSSTTSMADYYLFPDAPVLDSRVPADWTIQTVVDQPQTEAPVLPATSNSLAPRWETELPPKLQFFNQQPVSYTAHR